MLQDLTHLSHPFWSSDGDDLSDFISLIDSGKFNADEHILSIAVLKRKMKLFQLLTTRIFDLRNLQGQYEQFSLLAVAIKNDDLPFVDYLLDQMWTPENDTETVNPIVYCVWMILMENGPSMVNMIALFLNRGWKPEWHFEAVQFAAEHYSLEVCRPIFEAVNPQKVPFEVFFHLLIKSSPDNLQWIRNHWEIPPLRVIPTTYPSLFKSISLNRRSLEILLSKKSGKSWWLYPYDFPVLVQMASGVIDNHLPLFFESFSTPEQEADLRRLVDLYPEYDCYLLEKSCDLEF